MTVDGGPEQRLVQIISPPSSTSSLLRVPGMACVWIVSAWPAGYHCQIQYHSPLFLTPTATMCARTRETRRGNLILSTASRRR